MDDARVKAAAQTFVYGYPLVYCLDEIERFPAGTATVVPGVTPFNRFGHARELLGADAAFVSPNNDTLYSVAPFDVSGGPLVITVPDAADRYYVLQFIDAWTDNFAYVGRRSTGTAAGRFLLVPPGWSGPGVDGVSHVIEAPTTIGIILGRTQVNGPDDLTAVRAIQDGFDLTPLDPGGPTRGVPQPDPSVADDVRWWERLRVALTAFPRPAADAPFLEVAATLGLLDAGSPYATPDPELAAVLVAGKEQGEALVEQLSTSTLTMVDGWSSARHAFDYNLDHLGIGTIDRPEWRIDDRTKAYVTRAVAARLGLWGQHGYEADYEILWRDENDEPLDGSRRYEVTFAPPPPVAAFWSLTMYDASEYYLVANPIDRYSIGDRTPGLQLGDDGSVTILLQHDDPGPDRASNWLPTPAGRFRPVLRCYQPGPAILDGTYRFPPVRRVG